MINRELRQHGEIRNWLKPIERVFQSAQAGHFGLPDDLVAAMNHVHSIQEEIGAIGGVPSPPEFAAAAVQLAGGVVPGEPIPTDLGLRLLKEEAAFEETRAQIYMLRIAEAQAAGEVRSVFDSGAEAIVIEHLRPALQRLLQAADKAAPKLRGAQNADALLALQDQAAFKAWSELGLMHGRYRAIREAYDRVFEAVFQGELGATVPELGGLVRFRNFYELERTPEGALVLPADSAALMVWLVASEPLPIAWLPLPDELEPVVIEARQRVRQQQQAGFQRVQARSAATRRREAEELEEREAAHVTPWRS